MRSRISAVLLVLLMWVSEGAAQTIYRLPQVADGGGAIRTTFLFINNGTGDADVTLRLTDGAGEPMEFNIPGLDAGPEKSFPLPAGETRFFTSEGAGEGISVGAAVVESTAPIGVSAVFSLLTDGGALLLTEAGVGPAVASSGFVLAVDAEAPFNTGVALLNLEAEASEVTFRLFDTAGDPVGEPVERSLPANGHLAVFVGGGDGLFPALGDFKGRLVVEATSALAAVTLRQKVPPGAPLTTLPVVPLNSRRTSFNLPQVANGFADTLGIKTQFIIFSLGPGGTVTLETRDGEGRPFDVTLSDGDAAASFDLALPARGAVFVETDGRGPITVGSATVSSTVPIGVTAVFSLLDGEGNVTVEAGVGDSPLRSEFSLPVDLTGGFDTGVALFNPNDETVNVDFTLFGEGGAQVDSIGSSVGPWGHTAAFAGQLFADLGVLRGRLAVGADRPLAALSLRQDIAATTLTTLPVVARGGVVRATDPIAGRLRYVPAGTFVQGSPESDPCRRHDERPFTHTLTRGLAVMETEVTRRMWADLRTAQPSLPADPTDTQWGAGMNNPAQNVTWDETLLFANLLSVQRGLTRAYYVDAALTQPLTASNYETEDVYVDWDADGYRLPTEGEWEYFARVGTTTPFWVDEPHFNPDTCGVASCEAGTLPHLESAAWFCANAGWRTQPVGERASNPWGLKDVHGNVLEWVWDRYWPSYPAGVETDYRGSSAFALRVLRGGGYYNHAENVRSAKRFAFQPSSRYSHLGFRLVRSVE